MKRVKKAILDFDDLCDASVGKLELLKLLKAAMPGLKATLFTIPARCSQSTIDAARALPWVQLGVHGWQHSFGECLGWTKEEALVKMRRAFDMGIDAKVFRAPNWLLDDEVYLAARELDWIVADHEEYRVTNSGCRTYTYNKKIRDPRYIRLHGHLPNVSGNGIEEAFDQFLLPVETAFAHISEIA